jgi:hypothetical protein
MVIQIVLKTAAKIKLHFLFFFLSVHRAATSCIFEIFKSKPRASKTPLHMLAATTHSKNRC